MYEVYEMEKITSCMEKWKLWIDGNEKSRILPNTIWHDMIGLVTSQALLMSFKQSSILSNQSNSLDAFLSSNSTFMRYISRAFMREQAMYVRRLVDTRSDVHSLYRLLNNMKDNRHLFTRENYIDSYCYLNSKKIFTNASLEELHLGYDRLAGLKRGQDRASTDKISEGYFINLLSKLSSDELMKAKKHGDKFYFHSADNKSLQNYNRQDETLENYEKCAQILVEAFSTISGDFFQRSPVVKPMIDVAGFVQDIDKPFIPFDKVDELIEYMESIERKCIESNPTIISVN